MTPFDDDRSDMDILPGAPALSDSDVDALLAGRALPGYDDVHSTLRMLRTAGPPPIPAPSSALLAVMEAGFDPLPLTGLETAALASPWRRWGARLAVATAAVVATTLGAAAANALPAPIQNAVAGAVGALTPLDLPRRTGDRVLGESGAPLGEQSGEQPGPGSDPPSAAKSVPGSDPSPAGVTLPGDDLPPDDLSPRIPGQVGRPPSAQPTASTPAATDEHDDTDESNSDEADIPDTDEPDSDEPDVDEPSVDEPDVDEPDVDEPDVDEPDVDEPDVDEPDVDEPDVDEPDADDGEHVDD